MMDRPEPGPRWLAGLLTEQPQAGWRGALLRMGRVRGMGAITAVSVLAWLGVTAAVSVASGRADALATDLLVATLVPLIVAPLSVALVLVDIDHFKRINDTRGHAVGDEVLHRVAQALQAQVRPYDLAARFGGEEFVLMLPGSSAGEAAAVAERVRRAVQALQLPCLGDGPPSQVTVSLGVAALDAPPDDADALLRRADAALYEAKRGGRNRSVLSPPTP